MADPGCLWQETEEKQGGQMETVDLLVKNSKVDCRSLSKPEVCLAQDPDKKHLCVRNPDRNNLERKALFGQFQRVEPLGSLHGGGQETELAGYGMVCDDICTPWARYFLQPAPSS